MVCACDWAQTPSGWGDCSCCRRRRRALSRPVAPCRARRSYALCIHPHPRLEPTLSVRWFQRPRASTVPPPRGGEEVCGWVEDIPYSSCRLRTIVAHQYNQGTAVSPTTADFSSDRRTCFLKSSNHQLYFSSFGSERRVSISKIVTENHIVPVRGTDMKKSAYSSMMSVVVFSSGGAAPRPGEKETRGVSSFGARGLLGRHPAVSTGAPYPRGESTRNVDIGGPIF